MKANFAVIELIFQKSLQLRVTHTVRFLACARGLVAGPRLYGVANPGYLLKANQQGLLGWPNLAKHFHLCLVWLHNVDSRLPNQIMTAITTGQIKMVLAG